MQHGFYRDALHIYYGLLLKEHLARTQERLERDGLEDHCERLLKLCDWSNIQVSLFLLIGRAGIVNVRAVACIGI